MTENDNDTAPDVGATIRQVQAQVHATAAAKGWHPEPLFDVENKPRVERIASMLALIHSEVSETLECLRDGEDPRVWYFTGGKPEGFGIECADVAIRLMDMCGALGIDLQEMIEIKAAYNEQRAIRHGGKAL